MQNMTDDEYDKLIRRVCRIMFRNGESDFSKVLWRMSCGYKMEAFSIFKQYMANYGIEVDECLFDNACAFITDGCEVEWLEEGWKPYNENDSWSVRRHQTKLDELKKIDDYFEAKRQHESSNV